MKNNNLFHPDLMAAQEIAYELNGLFCTNIVIDKESSDYGACTFQINNKNVVFRVAKITPTKVGQFVTLWKRIGASPIMPFDISDPIDLFIVTVRKDKLFGQFIFPKEVLWQKGFVSKEVKGGKRAMRVYPPWDIADSKQAKKTQEWQLLYFVALAPVTDHEKLTSLVLKYGINNV